MNNFPLPLSGICQRPRSTFLFWTGPSTAAACLVLGQAFRGPGLKVLPPRPRHCLSSTLLLVQPHSLQRACGAGAGFVGQKPCELIKASYGLEMAV